MESSVIHGECGEVIEVATSKIKSEDTQEHTGVILDIDGVIVETTGDFCVILSPSEAKNLASKLLEVAEAADNENYQRLLNK